MLSSRSPGISINWERALVFARLSQLAYLADKVYLSGKLIEGWTHVSSFSNPDTGTMGFVAIRENEICVSLKGTDSLKDAFQDIKIKPMDVIFSEWALKMPLGFAEDFVALREEVADKVQSLAQKLGSCVVWVTGHSLGGALAQAHALDLSLKGHTVGIYTYGAPQSFEDEGADFYDAHIDTSWRIVHERDMIPHILHFMNYAHVSKLVHISDQGLELNPLRSLWQRFWSNVHRIGVSLEAPIEDHLITNYVRCLERRG